MTTKSTSKDLLNEKIKQLELQQANQVTEIKSSYADLLESLQPAKIVGSAMKNVIATPGLKSTFIDTIWKYFQTNCRTRYSVFGNQYG